MKTKWFWVSFELTVGEHFCKSHAVCSMLKDHIIKDMTSRGGKIKESKDIDCVSFDLPGMVYMDRPLEELKIPGLTIVMPSEDLDYFLEQLKHSKSRKEGKFTYYKLYTNDRVIVLTPAQHKNLGKIMEEHLPGAEEKCKIFYASRDVPSVCLKKINAEVNKVDIKEVPDCGAHKADRFIPKIIGEA